MSVPNTRLKGLLLKKVQEKGYKSIRDFTERTGVSRSPITKVLRGISRPSTQTVNRWCEILECTSQERKEIYHAVGYLSPDEMESVTPLELIA